MAFRPLKKHSPCLGDANQRTACIGSFPRVHELVARAVRGKCVRHRIKQKSAVLRSPQSKLYHACKHIARKSRADSCTHCLHARWKKRGGRGEVPALTEWSEMFSFIAGRRFAAERWSCSYKTGNFAHVEKRGKIINSLWKSLLKTLIYNGFRILLFQGGKKAVFRDSHKNRR